MDRLVVARDGFERRAASLSESADALIPVTDELEAVCGRKLDLARQIADAS